MFKPVAFCISKDIIPNIKFYSDKINMFEIKTNNGYRVSIWHIGNSSEMENKNFYFSFPQNSSLLDRNLIIKIEDNSITIENDWLGSIPVFYNNKELIISNIPNLCLKDKSIDEDGLHNFFRFGYSVFEKTPFKNVQFLRYYSKIILTKDNLELNYKRDPIISFDIENTQSEPSDVISAIRNYVSNCEKQIDGDIIIPTSGGLDSRLLNWSVSNKNRIRSYTYGISTEQSKSSEVVYAKKISEVLGTKWEQIELNNCNKYIDEWYRLFGFSTHLHGMYQIEFYRKIYAKLNLNQNVSLLSGIGGDLWAGGIPPKKISNPIDIVKLGYTHELTLNKKLYNKNFTSQSLNNYFNGNRQLLNSNYFQIITTARIKLILISYLMSVPEYFGIPAWTPFLNFDIVTKMLSIDDDLRKNRKWQKDFFDEVGLNLEKMNLSTSSTNSLNFEMAKKFRFEKIDEKYLNSLVKPHKIRVLNKIINNTNIFIKIIEYFLIKFKIRGLLRRIGFKRVGYLNHLHSYHVLKAIEKTLK